MPKAIRKTSRRASPSRARIRRVVAPPLSGDFPGKAGKPAALASIEDPLDPDITQAEAVERSRKRIINAAPAITEGVIRQAKEGSYLHARMLFDFAGLTAVQPPEAAGVSPVLELLMKELEKPLTKQATA